MKTILLASAFLFAVSGSALAADAVVYQEGAAAYNWSGIYVGGAIGYNQLSLQDIDYEDEHFSDGGVSGALYAGYNHQIGNFVLGVEADIKASSADVPEDPAYLRYDSRWAASFRGRAGYAAGAFMPYLTGGYAVASFTGHHNDAGTDNATETVSGYVVGGGVEWAATQNIIVRAEYLFSDYGTNEFLYSGNDDHHVDMRTHDVRLGVAYKF